MASHPRSVAGRYGLSVLAVTLALLLTLAIRPIQGDSSTSLFFAAVMVSSWYGGLGPGLLATALATMAIDYFFVSPTFAVIIGPSDLTRIGVFVMVAMLINSLNTSRHRLAMALRRRAGQLAEADRRKDEFLATLAHELRGPLSSIRYALFVLDRLGDASPPAAEARECIGRQVRSMALLVDDLIDTSRIGRGELVLRREEVDLGTVVDHSVATARPLIEARGHDLSVRLPSEPVVLDADPMRLEQVLVNLLSNAARYTEPGGRIGMVVERDGDLAVVRVKDNGIGIAPDILPRVFELFVQDRRADRRGSEGLGIGLALVRSLVELHGGVVEAHSDGPGCGSEFVVRLPAAPRREASDGLVPAVVAGSAGEK